MKKWLKIFISILSFLLIAFIITAILVDIYVYGNSLDMSDWLVAGCSVLSLVGTVTLAIIAVMQTDEANKQNQALIKQNEELQKINDRQFKIANQKYYPLLDISEVKMTCGEDICPPLSNWAHSSENFINKASPAARLSIDARRGPQKKTSLYSKVVLSIINMSDAIIQEIEIYKLSASTPLNSIVDTDWNLTIFTLSRGKKLSISLTFYHDIVIFNSRSDELVFSIYLKLKTITGVIFYEKIYVAAEPSFSYGVVEKISEEKINN